MKQTKKLRLRASASSDRNTVGINPNEGLDLNLMMISYDVKMFMGAKQTDAFMEGKGGIKGKIVMPNEIDMGICEMNPKDCSELGNPKFVIIHRDEEKLLVSEQSD